MAIDISKIKPQPAVKVKEKGDIFDFLNKDIKLFEPKLSDKKKEAFYLDLSVLLSAGVDIKTTLELIEKEQTEAKDKALYREIMDAVISGLSLSNALKKTGKFSPYEYFSLEIGEESGKITIVMKELAEYYQKKLKQRRQIISALSYPAIVLFVSLGAIFFMMNFVVPTFADVYKRFGGKLPFITQVIVSASDFFLNYAGYFFLFVLITVGILFTQRNNELYRKISTALLLKIPFIGPIMRKIYLARFCHSMTLLMGAKIPIIRALALVKQMIRFYPIEVSLSEIEKDVMQGQSLNKSLSKFSIYTPRMVSLIKVGEEVNQLETFFDKIAKQYSDEVEHETGLLGTLVEPFMLVFLGGVVGIILVAMYLPMFQLSSTFK